MYVFFILFLICVLCSCALIWSDASNYIKTGLIVTMMVSSLLSFHVLDSYLGSEKEVLSLPNKLLICGFTMTREKTNILCIIDGQPKHLSFATNPKVQKALNEGRGKYKGKPFELTLKGEAGKGEGGKDVKGNSKDKDKGKGKNASISLKSISSVEHNLPEANVPEKIQ